MAPIGSLPETYIKLNICTTDIHCEFSCSQALNSTTIHTHSYTFLYSTHIQKCSPDSLSSSLPPWPFSLVLSLLVTALTAALDPFNAVRFFFPIPNLVPQFIFDYFLGNQSYQDSSNEAAIIAAILNVHVPVKTLIGMNCSPITGIGRGGSNWYTLFLPFILL